jgi:hypothetical protein
MLNSTITRATLSPSLSPAPVAGSCRGQLFLEDRDAEIAGLHALSDADLEDLKNLLDRSARFQRILNVSSRSRRVHVGERSVEGDVQKLDLLGRQDAAPVNAGARRHEGVRPAGVDREERLPGDVPLSNRLYLFDSRLATGDPGFVVTPAAFASSRRMGAPRLQA